MSVNENQPRNNSGRATARADAVNHPEEDEVYECPIKGCGRTFVKKGGLGVQLQRTHKDDYDRIKLAEGEGKQRKIHWSDET